MIDTDKIKPPRDKARKHPPAQIRKIARSLTEFGQVLPVILDADDHVVDGWAVVQAANLLALGQVYAVRLTELKPEQLRILRLALNRIAQDTDWDIEELKLEFEAIISIDASFDLDLTGFEGPEIDVILDPLSGTPLEDPVPEPSTDTPPVSRPGDVFCLGRHRLMCGSALDQAAYQTLLGSQKAQIVVTDPPYNVAIPGHVSGNGRVRHQNFAMACGEMSDEEYVTFLRTACGLCVRYATDGSLHFIFIDWRHLQHLQTAATSVYDDHLNTCVWTKTNPAMGSFYRSQHELIPVFKCGTAPHINNIELGKHGRNRSNVWIYPGASSLGSESRALLEHHPTVKPITLVADILKDASHRRGIVLDPFMGSGTTIIAAERTGRIAYGIEIDPAYVDVAIRRWQDETDSDAKHSATGLTFNDLEHHRQSDAGDLSTPKDE